MKRNNFGFDEKLAEMVYKFVDLKNDGFSPDSSKAKALVLEWQRFMTENYYECTDELLEALGSMYAGEDFREKIDVFGKGTARYMSDAIFAYFKEKSKA